DPDVRPDRLGIPEDCDVQVRMYVGDEARVLDAHPRYRGRGVVGRAPHASPPEDRSAREDYEQDEADRRPSPPADRRWGGPGRAGRYPRRDSWTNLSIPP